MQDQDNNKQNKKKMEHWKVVNMLLVAYDILTIAFSYFAALWVRFDFRFSQIPKTYLGLCIRFVCIYVAVCIIVYLSMRLYKSIWRFASYNELLRCIMATFITFVLHVGVSLIIGNRMPASYYAFGIVFQFFFAVGIRFAYRFILLLRGIKRAKGSEIPVMIIGAGQSGQMLLRDIKISKETNEKAVCFIDDNPNKWNRYVDNVLVVGGRSKIAEAVVKNEIKKIYLAVPSATARQKKELLDICNNTGCEIKMLPGMYQFRTGDITVSAMKDVEVEDLLGRDPVKVNTDEMLEMIHDKVILVTGGGGSIGSELCRQLAVHDPKQLIIFDIYENNAYDIQIELKKNFPDLKLATIIGSVRDSRKLFQVFETYRPDIVFHAAAHKHVPLMEDSPCEAIKNNAIGTYKTAYAAMVFGTERFVLISTDKAVNPTNIMGASKRICEMIIQAFDHKIKEGKASEIPQIFTHLLEDEKNIERAKEQLKYAHTEFVAVRFGNVLGSNGSVIPLFKKQIEEGGPVTVTHPDIIRYFMTIPEAVSLVIQAGYYAQGGDIFVLDMGEPVKIDTLARNLIKLSGHVPDEDIKIVYTGLRPGEKLYEEKLMAEEGLKKTPNELIHIGMPIPFDIDTFLGQLDELLLAAYKNKDNIRELVQEVVSTYHPV